MHTNTTTLSTTTTEEELLLPLTFTHPTRATSLMARRRRSYTPTIPAWFKAPKTILVVRNGGVLKAENQSNTLSIWIDLQMNIPATEHFRRTTLWTAAEVVKAEIEA